MLYLADNQGQMLACASLQEGQHHDLCNIQELFEELLNMLTKANSSFDSMELGQICKDKEIEANIDVNTHNNKIYKNQSIEYQYFD